MLESTRLNGICGQICLFFPSVGVVVVYFSLTGFAWLVNKRPMLLCMLTAKSTSTLLLFLMLVFWFVSKSRANLLNRSLELAPKQHDKNSNTMAARSWRRQAWPMDRASWAAPLWGATRQKKPLLWIVWSSTRRETIDGTALDFQSLQSKDCICK